MTRRIVSSGLAPSASLAPSTSLAPATTIYAGGPITPHQVWMGLGTSGAVIDISTYVEFGQGITRTYGRQTEFDDTNPGTFTFTLNNTDGRFTPDNPNSPYATTVAEGMGVQWLVGTRLIVGSILSIEIPADEASWDQIVITCDDMLGTAGRHGYTTLPDALLARTAPKVLWKLDEPSGDQSGVESFGDPLGPFSLFRSNPNSTTQVAFGATQVAGLPGTAVTVSAAAGETNWFGTRHGNTVLNTRITSPYLAAGTSTGQIVTVGFWSMWVYPNSNINFAVVPKFGVENPGYAWSAQIRCTPTSITAKPGNSAGFVYNLTAAEQLVPHFVTIQLAMVWGSIGAYWTLGEYLYVDGSYKGNAAWYDPQHGYNCPAYANSLSPVEVSVSVTGGSTALSGTVQRIAYSSSQYLPAEYLAVQNTLDSRRVVADSVGDDINTEVYNGPLSTAPIGFPADTNRTLLDLLNDIVRTESGYLFVQSTGQPGQTVTTYIEVRARDRPQTPETVFDASLDLDGPPSFVRDITNVAASVDVSGPAETITVTDPSITGRYITTGAAETVLYSGVEDLREWGQDRLQRGKNRAVRAQTFTVNAVTTPVDRSTDLLNLVPGDRVQLSNLPAGRLGFSTWDGWVIGGSESHTVDGNRFTFTVSPTLPNTAVYDTDRFAGGGDLMLGNTYTATATSLVFNANYATPVSTATPYTIQIDLEQLTVTAVTGSTFTVTRGVNGTTAAPHNVNAQIEIVPAAIYAY